MTTSAIPGQTKVDYQQIRGDIQTGDILLFRGSHPLSKVIEKISGSPYSHVAFLTRWEGRIIALQSDLRGVEVIPASMIVCKYEGKVEWWRLGGAHREAFDGRDFLDRALTLIGIRYGYLSLMWLGLRIALGMTVVRKLSHLKPSSLFCSSFVSYCYENEGISINAKAGPGGTSPADFALSGLFGDPRVLYDGSDTKACDQLLATRLGKKKAGRGQQPGSVWTGLARRDSRRLPAAPSAEAQLYPADPAR